MIRLGLVLLMAAWSPLEAADQPLTVILVRHAERAGGMAPDVGLSSAGRCRSKVLARMLSDAGIQRIYVSDVARTQQTAKPLADRIRIRPEIVPSKDVDALVAKLQTGGGTALIVGHSNTLPEIIQRIGGGNVKPIDDREFDLLFVATSTAPDRASLVTLRYAGCGK